MVVMATSYPRRPVRSSAARISPMIERRPFGRTGHQSSATLFRAAALARASQADADLIQLHSLAHPDDWEQALGPGGALEAAVEAREQKLVRFIGVTGHGWTIAAMHKRSLARFDFDSVLMPFNFFMAQSERYRQNFEEVLDLCRERNVAVQVIKSIARGPWATADRTRTTGYQPLE